MQQRARLESPLSPRFDDALAYASRLHRDQFRKGGSIPYVSHLLAVTAIVLEHGGTEDEAIAALLHDAVEDQGGTATREAIRERFGEVVVAIVDAAPTPIRSRSPHGMYARKLTSSMSPTPPHRSASSRPPTNCTT